jgi:hypothetical protein
MSGNVDMGEKRQTRHPLRVIMGRLIYLAWKIYFAFSVPVVRIILKFPICEIIFTNLKYPVQQFFKLKLTRSFFKSNTRQIFPRDGCFKMPTFSGAVKNAEEETIRRFAHD